MELENYVVVCWDPTELFLDGPGVTFIMATSEQDAIEKVKAMDPDEAEIYEWSAHKVK